MCIVVRRSVTRLLVLEKIEPVLGLNLLGQESVWALAVMTVGWPFSDEQTIYWIR